MKKIVLAVLSVIMVTLMGVMAVGCGKEELNFGKEAVRSKTQLDSLTNLKTGTVDVAVIDSVMAGYYTSKGEYKNDLMVVSNLVLAEEKYGIAGRKEDKSLMHMVNVGLMEMYENEEYQDLAENFGLQDSTLAITTDAYANATDDSWSKIRARKKIVIGYTIFAPIAFTNDNQLPNSDASNLTGFDTELARKMVGYWNLLGNDIKVEFQEIDWDSKEALLKNGTIDLIWNGMTITAERSAEMCISSPYLANKQVAVIRKEDANKYTTTESMKKAVIGFEGGSAGEDVVIKK